jgi:translocation and assembly module TamB
VLVSGEPDTPGAERELHAEVRLTLGDEVHFDGFGLTARLEGDVLARQEPATPTTATGELRILDGEYRAYGQGLVIDSGRIYFAGGPVTEPALDVRAVRRPKEGILVGAHVQGTLQEPSFELFSEPSMTQQEQLSYLVLGRSLDETPDGQGSALNRAVLAMGLKGGDFLAKNIGQHVGVDEIGIETGSGEAGAPSDPEEAALVVGKYLSPKLYVSYGIGLFDPESVLELQYEISRNWKLVTQSSGESTGADVLYTVERGRN